MEEYDDDLSLTEKKQELVRRINSLSRDTLISIAQIVQHSEKITGEQYMDDCSEGIMINLDKLPELTLNDLHTLLIQNI